MNPKASGFFGLMNLSIYELNAFCKLSFSYISSRVDISDSLNLFIT